MTGPDGGEATVPGAPGPSTSGIDQGPGESGHAELVPTSVRLPATPDRPELTRLADPDSRAPLPPPRRDARVGSPPRDPDWMVNQLPVGMVQDDFFVRFVSIFQDVATSLLEDADNLEHIPDLTVTPTPLISVLAAWIGAEAVDENLPEDLQRTLLARSGRAMSRRGTVDGLRQYLQMLSDGPAEVLDGGGIWPEGDAPADVAWVRMQVHGTGHLSEDEFVRMVRHQVPAHVRAELFIADRRVLATAEAAQPTAGPIRTIPTPQSPTPQSPTLPDPGSQSPTLPDPGSQSPTLPDPGPQSATPPDPGPPDPAQPNPTQESP